MFFPPRDKAQSYRGQSSKISNILPLFSEVFLCCKETSGCSCPVAHAGGQDSIKHDIQGATRKEYTPVHTLLNRQKKQTHDFTCMGSFYKQHAHTIAFVELFKQHHQVDLCGCATSIHTLRCFTAIKCLDDQLDITYHSSSGSVTCR